MHQQDVSKDDMLEALLAILNKMKEYIFNKKKEENNHTNELNSENKVDKFRKILDYVKEQNISTEVNQLVDNMKSNPERSIELLNEIVKAKMNNNLEIAKEKVSSLCIEEPKELSISQDDIETLKDIKEEFTKKIDMLIRKYSDITNQKESQINESNTNHLTNDMKQESQHKENDLSLEREM